jgi:predicted acyl esterase
MRGEPIVRQPAAFRYLFALLFALCITPAACAQNPPETFRVAMEDGTELVTDVHLPEGEGPWPVVLMRSTYGRALAPRDEFLSAGYALVVQDVRGMGESPGEAHVFHAEGWRPGLMDGKDTVDWVAAQPWCNGLIGTYGGSALAITQMLVAPTTEKIAAQYLEVGPASFYHDGVYPGGVFRKRMLEGWLTAIQQPHLIAVYKSHPYADEFWSYLNVLPKAEDVTAPGIFVGAWYDIFCQGTIDAFLAREERGGVGARGANYLIMKWGGHGPYQGTDYAYPKNTEDLKVSKIREAFFRAHLQDDKRGLARIPKVHYYTLGDDTAPDAPGNEWRTADAWPPFDTVETPLYLTRAGLERTSPTEAESKSFTFDPKDPYPTHGGPNLLLPFGPYDQRKFSKDRKDLLIFETPALETPLEITGQVRCKLYVSSDAPDTDFTAKLVDVYPDGREINLLDGIMRVKLREGFAQPLPLLEGPGQVVAVDIDLWTTSIVINAGHKIALHISSSNYPRFEVNPNTGDDFPPEDATAMRAAENSIHFGGEYPSALLLPARP